MITKLQHVPLLTRPSRSPIQFVCALRSKSRFSGLKPLDYQKSITNQSSRLSRCTAINLDTTQRIDRQPLDDEFIWSLILKQKKQLVVACLSLLFCVGSNLASPVLSGLLFETLVMKEPFSTYGTFLIFLIVLYVLEPIISRVYVINVCAIGENVQSMLRREAFRVLLMQRIEFFDRHRSSELTSIVTRDLESLRNFFFNNSSRDRGFRAALEALGSILVLFGLSWRLGPILAGVVVATGFTAWIYRQQSKLLEKSSAEAHSRMAMAVDETVSQVRTVRVFAGESLERERFGSFASDAYISGMGFARAKALLECLNRGAIHLSLLALYSLGGYLVNNGLMPIRVLLSAVGFTFSLVFATQGVLQTWTDARQTLSSLKRVQDVLAEYPVDPSMEEALPPGAWWKVANEDVEEEQIAKVAKPVPGIGAQEAAEKMDIILEGVEFSYPVRPDIPVLRDLTLTIPAGKVTALVGRSGAGKSTIAGLLERLYSPNSGTLKLGDTPIDLFPRSEWVQALTAVTQEPVLFNATIHDNISYGAPHATQEEIEAAAKAANAHEFIQKLPEAYDSMVGEQGGLLSGGQRQRIALARALLKDAPILILDEATSALDSESERLVKQAIQNLMKGRTVLIIAHRLSTVQAADQILVIEDGEVAERGTHDELNRLGGRYSALVSNQSLSLSNQ